jgi:hypothetical protein
MEKLRQDLTEISAGSVETCLAFLGVLFGAARLKLLQISERAVVNNNLWERVSILIS